MGFLGARARRRAVAGVTPPVELIDGAVLAQRRLVARGSLTARAKSTSAGKTDEMPLEFYFDGPKLRWDHPVDVAGGSRHVVRTACTDSSFTMVHEQTPGAPSVSALIYGPGFCERFTPDASPDPRLFGLCTTALSHAGAHAESYVGAVNRKNLSVARIERDGESSLEVNYENVAGGTVAYRVDPWRACVTRIVGGFVDRDAGAIQDVVEVRHALVAGLWFPDRVSQRRTSRGELESSYELEVTINSLNGPLAAETFVLPGMGAAPGTHVTFLPNDGRGLMEWDGRRLTTGEGRGLAIDDATPAHNLFDVELRHAKTPRAWRR